MKLMEAMINNRLEWYFEEEKNLLPSFMSGFRKGRSTIDNIINLENDIQKNINNKNQPYF